MMEGNHRGGTHPGVPGERAEIGDPLERLRREHALQLELCCALEHIADGLPDSVDRRLIGEVVIVLSQGMSRHFRFEEMVLFPLLRSRARGEAALVAALDQLEDEHDRDGDMCAELIDQLEILRTAGRVGNPDMLGYMLRGFFEGQRRHIEWENAIVLPAAGRLLDEADLAALNLQMSAALP
jgi:hemerythrin-like domain-containing protein